MMDATNQLRPRRTYHHGDLRQALLEAGIALARVGGPEAVVLREATRRASVVPNAAYRHFVSRDALLQEVRSAALSMLALAMEKELIRQRRRKQGKDAARASLRAIGIAYLRFARTEPGLFRTAFGVPGNPETTTQPAMAGKSGLNPFQLLSIALDEWCKRACCPCSSDRCGVSRLVCRARAGDAGPGRSAASAATRAGPPHRTASGHDGRAGLVAGLGPGGEPAKSLYPPPTRSHSASADGAAPSDDGWWRLMVDAS